MKRYVLLLALILAAGPPPAGAAAQDEAARAEKAWAAAVVAGDHATLDRILAEGLIYTHSSGLVEDRSVYFGKLKSGALKYEAIEHESITVKPYGNTAIVHSKARMRGVSDGKPFNVYSVMTHTWVKQGGVWKLAAHQATRLP